MRLSADWMTLADERILEFLSEEKPTTPKNMTDDGRIRFSRPYVNVRCKKLVEYGLLEPLGNGVYMITDDGQAYLDEELDAAELEASGGD